MDGGAVLTLTLTLTSTLTLTPTLTPYPNPNSNPNPNPYQVAPCGHAGCYECLVGWVEERSNCPVCKAKCEVELLYEVAPPPPPPPPPQLPQPPGSELAEGIVGVGSAAVGSGEAGGGLDKALVREYGTKIAALVQLVGQACHPRLQPLLHTVTASVASGSTVRTAPV